MPRKTHLESDRRGEVPPMVALLERRQARPKAKVDFPIEALDYKNVNLLKQFVTEQGRILPRKYTGLPAHYQRRLARAIKRARQMLLMR
ncbi:30S ribosomal protein S18 [Limisphaera ngatamarikiensis]|jgi:small subunit ribosomal protein S18|uniref:30S ribosomal protein S18 n=1 Tax=Limisphaera ngatamarikiensis TaxID=1324935 RepID=A0A6M1RQ20_9BACT|nr:30S ribosomal protein S18 [Limisphaera ngatamarikiensis]